MLYCYWDAFTVSLSFCFDTWCLKPALDNNAGSLPDICGEIVRCEGGIAACALYNVFGWLLPLSADHKATSTLMGDE